MARLSVQNIGISFGFEEILKDISLEINTQESVAIVGPSGAGKTTFMRICAGFLDQDDGMVKNSFTNTSFAFQNPRLVPWKNTLDNISMPLRAKKDKDAKEKAKQIALRFGLESTDLSKFPKDLSGGMRQRVSFARALVTNPDLLFLDEPFSALDIGLVRDLQGYLKEYIKLTKMSLLFITHNIEDAVRLADKILLFSTSPAQIVKSFSIDQGDEFYVHKTTAEILGDDEFKKVFEL